MTITDKIIGILAILGLVAAFEAGVHSVDILTSKVDTTTQDQTKTTIVTTKKPDGSSTTTEIIDDKSQTETDAITKTPVASRQKTNISAIVSEDIRHLNSTPAYGLSFTREFIGPVTLGAFGLTNGTVGISLGVNF
jgi:hypothetical protein